MEAGTQTDRQTDRQDTHTPSEYTDLNRARNGEGNQHRQGLVTRVTSPAHIKNDSQPIADQEWIEDKLLLSHRCLPRSTPGRIPCHSGCIFPLWSCLSLPRHVSASRPGSKVLHIKFPCGRSSWAWPNFQRNLRRTGQPKLQVE